MRLVYLAASSLLTGAYDKKVIVNCSFLIVDNKMLTFGKHLLKRKISRTEIKTNITFQKQ